MLKYILLPLSWMHYENIDVSFIYQKYTTFITIISLKEGENANFIGISVIIIYMTVYCFL